MASSLLRTCGLLRSARRTSYFGTTSRIYTRTSAFPKIKGSRQILKVCTGIGIGILTTCGSCLYILDKRVLATGEELEVPHYPWSFNGLLTSLDHAAVRRGWQVYKTICSTCHSLQYVSYQDLVNVTHTEEEVKALAAEVEVEDGPDDEGNYFKRPGKLSDKIPPPFPNEQAARAANNGAYPADLTYMVNAKRNGENYIFSVLTGYMEAPAGIEIREGQSFNAYFPGGSLLMPQMVVDDAVQYDDNTKAYTSQQAKDVVEFLVWTSSIEFDTRKVMMLKDMWEVLCRNRATRVVKTLPGSFSFMWRYAKNSVLISERHQGSDAEDDDDDDDIRGGRHQRKRVSLVQPVVFHSYDRFRPRKTSRS